MKFNQISSNFPTCIDTSIFEHRINWLFILYSLAVTAEQPPPLEDVPEVAIAATTVRYTPFSAVKTRGSVEED